MDTKIVTRAFIFNADWELLLAKHSTNGLWVLPGGHVESWENIHDAILREVREEFGIEARFFDIDSEENLHHKGKKIKNLPLPISIYSLEYTNKKGEDKSRIEYIFLMETDVNIVKIQESEIAEYRWFDPMEVLSMKPNIETWDFYIEMLEKIIDPEDE